MTPEPVYAVGIHILPFGRYPDRDVIDLGTAAVRGALDDAALRIQDIQVLGVGSLYETGLGQRLQHQIGQTGAPVYNVHNACATGATAVRVAHLAVGAGEADLALAVGVEQMGKNGLLGAAKQARDSAGVFEPSGRYGAVMGLEGRLGTSLMPGVFAQAGLEYAGQHDGVGLEQFAKVAEKNHAHSTLNPLAQYQRAFTLEEILAAEMIAYPNTLLMCCPTGDGAAAAVLASRAGLAKLDPDVRRRAVKVSASVLTTDAWSAGSESLPDINTPTRDAARAAYERAGVGPEDLDVVELHDCFATAELLHYDNLGLCEPGGAGEFIDSGAPRRTGRLPVNPSGGLISKGHPIGATGVAGLCEIACHLRGEAGERQIEGAKVGLAHVIGLGTSCAIHILEATL